MKIVITEHIRKVRTRYEGGKEVLEDFVENTGREWSVDIPVEPVAMKEVWLGLVCDLQNLIETFRRARHD